MEIRQLRYFLTVAEELHFGRAAARLHIVQSAVSQQVRRLERELGARLFERTTRAVRLTEAGQRLIPHAERIMAEVAQAQTELDDLRTEGSVALRLGTSTGLGRRLDAILEQFARLAPDADLELATASAAVRIRQVRTGELDAALVRGGQPDTGLTTLPVWTDSLVAAIPARHALAVRDRIPLAQLAELPLRLASRRRNQELHDLVVRCCRDAGFTPIFGPEFTTDQDTLAAIGHGAPSWTVYYRAQADQITVAGVVFRSLCNPEPAMPTYLAVRPGPRRRVLRALIEACQTESGA